MMLGVSGAGGGEVVSGEEMLSLGIATLILYGINDSGEGSP